jgi:hypothetical protein
VIYAKRPFAGPAQVLDYVGRYARVAISSNPLVSIDNGKVRFRWKDYRNGNRQKIMTLEAGLPPTKTDDNESHSYYSLRGSGDVDRSDRTRGVAGSMA